MKASGNDGCDPEEHRIAAGPVTTVPRQRKDYRPREVRAKFIAHQGHMFILTVSLMELTYGAEKSAQPDRNLRDIEAFASRLRILPYDREVAMHTGSIRAALARVGTPIGPTDQMIAGHARSRGLIVVTANTDGFGRVPGISVEDWTKADGSS